MLKAAERGFEGRAQQKLPSELQNIPLNEKDFELEPGKHLEAHTVYMGDFDMDTAMGYCIARHQGYVQPEAKLIIRNHAVPQEMAADPGVLKIEASIDAPAETNTEEERKELEIERRVLQRLQQPTHDVDARLKALTETTAEQRMAKRGVVSHTGEQQFCAAAQLFALTGREDALKYVATYTQMVEVTRSFPRVQMERSVGPTLTQLVYAIKEKYAPQGGIKAEVIPQMMEEIYQLFQHAVAQGENLFQGIPLQGTPFAEYATTIQQKKERQREQLQDIRIEQALETATGVRVAMVDGTATTSGAFAKLKNMVDEHGRPLAEVTVLRGADGQVKVNVHDQIKNIDLLQLAGILNAKEIGKGEIELSADNKFGGHDVKKKRSGAAGSQIIGSPRETGSSLRPEEIFAIVTEYIEQPRPTKKDLEAFASDTGMKGAVVVSVPGFGPRAVPELGIQYVETRSAQVDPTLASGGVYGDRLRMVRASQIDFAEKRVRSGRELFEQYLRSGQSERSLKMLTQIGDQDRAELLQSPAHLNALWERTVNNPRAIPEVYAPVGREYLAPHFKQMNVWMGTDEDRARASFVNPESARYMFDTTVMDYERTHRAPGEFAAQLQQMLRHPEIRAQFSSGRIFGRLLTEVLAIATQTETVSPYQRWKPEDIAQSERWPEELAGEMREYIVGELSVQEVRYMRATVERQLRNIADPAARAQFIERMRPLVEALKTRPDYADIIAEDAAEHTHIERRADTHPQKVVLLQIGNREGADMKGGVEKRVRQLYPDKNSWDTSISRDAFLANREELLHIVNSTVMEVEALARQEETQTVDIYALCPISILALVADRLANRGIHANYGQWINGVYELFRPEELERALPQRTPSEFEQLWK